jgi:hypothetical protein
LIGAETGIKTIAAMHSQCPLLVIRARKIQRLCRRTSALNLLSTKMVRRRDMTQRANRVASHCGKRSGFSPSRCTTAPNFVLWCFSDPVAVRVEGR